MTARPIRTRAELLAQIVDRPVLTTACRRAINEGRAQVLGGFTTTEGIPCWVVRVTSRYNRQWQYALEVLDGQYRLRRHPQVYWEDWQGDPEGRRLIDGDDPVTFAALRDAARNPEETPDEAPEDDPAR
jgi:hypothetical protein